MYLTFFFMVLHRTFIRLCCCESAKSCAMHAKNVLTCQRVLRAHVLTCRYALRTQVLVCQRVLRAYVLTCQRALSTYVLCVSTWLAYLCIHVSTCLTSSRAHVKTCFESLASRSLCDQVITCKHDLPPWLVVLMPLFQFHYNCC